MILGVGQALVAPSSLSLIADYFERKERAKASALYSFGIYLGCGLSSVNILLGEDWGWRAACFFSALRSIFLFLSFFVTISLFVCVLQCVSWLL